MPTHELRDFMDSATRQMGEEYDRIQRRATEDPGTAGDQGEENWATLLRNWLPPIFQIVTKGRILSHTGIASPQIDILVLQPEYPKHLLDKKLYLAGGVLAAFECKVTLKASHIEEFIKNSIEVKSHAEKRKGTPYRELQSPILYGLLAHSHSWKGESSTPVENIELKLYNIDAALVGHPVQMPDIVCVADLGCWSSSKMVFTGPAKHSDWESLRSSFGYPEKGGASTMYMGRTKDHDKQADYYSPIGAMIVSLLRKLAWEYPNLRQLSSYFSSVSIAGNTQGFPIHWTSGIYSDEIRERVELEQFENCKWNEWNIFIY